MKLTCEIIENQLAMLLLCSDELKQNEKQRRPAIMVNSAEDQEKGRQQKTLNDLLVQFWEFIVVGSPDECWTWTGTVFPSGYGRIWFNWRNIRTHRLSFMASNGPIPKGMRVCHKCDNPPCCNPDHLFLGTDKDNWDDSMRKKRRKIVSGDRHHFTKITANDVISIRNRYFKTGPRRGNGQELAEEFGVTQGAIMKIVKRKNWKHIL